MFAEVFKVCLDYWNKFVPDIFTSVHQLRAGGGDPFQVHMSNQQQGAIAVAEEAESRAYVVLPQLALLRLH